jgi:hypothetical protein
MKSMLHVLESQPRDVQAALLGALRPYGVGQ